jgi:hypothetical protein
MRAMPKVGSRPLVAVGFGPCLGFDLILSFGLPRFRQDGSNLDPRIGNFGRPRHQPSMTDLAGFMSARES